MAEDEMTGERPERNKEIGEETLPDSGPKSGQKRPLSGERDKRFDDGQQKVAQRSKGGESVKDVATSITLEEIDALISQVSGLPAGVQGSGTGSSQDNSHFLHENSIVQDKGSRGRDDARSQVRVNLAKTKVDEFFRSAGNECRLADLGDLLMDILMILDDNRGCRPRPIAGKKAIFPLPVSGCPGVPSTERSFLQLLAASLNSMHGVSCAGQANPVSMRVLKRLQSILEGSVFLAEPLPQIDFAQVFSTKGVDYQGEEIRVARKVVWESIEASLPAQVGSLDIRDFCSSEVLYYINHFEDFLWPVEDQTLGKAPRVFVDDEEWPTVAKGLLDRGICVPAKVADLHHVGSSPLVNGLFSVSKDEYVGNVELCRLIMNLKPVNSITRPLEADTCTLPMVTHLAALYLDDGELLTVSSEDLRCYFYLFAVPQAWHKYLGFGRLLPSSLIPPGGDKSEWVLCGRVLPMGFLNSVGIAQHIHRNVVRRSMGSLHPPWGAERELRRDRGFSHQSELYRVYLDNFDELRKVDRKTHALVTGQVSESVRRLRETYESFGLPTHPKKTVQQLDKAEVQGAWIDGDTGTMCAKPSKVARYVRLALEVVRSGKASQKELQIVGGGLVYLAMFKRPLLGALNHIWKAITDLDGLPRSQRFLVRREVLAELVRFI